MRYTSYLTIIDSVRVCYVNVWDVSTLQFDLYKDVLVGTTGALVCGIGVRMCGYFYVIDRKTRLRIETLHRYDVLLGVAVVSNKG